MKDYSENITNMPLRLRPYYNALVELFVRHLDKNMSNGSCSRCYFQASRLNDVLQVDADTARRALFQLYRLGFVSRLSVSGKACFEPLRVPFVRLEVNMNRWVLDQEGGAE